MHTLHHIHLGTTRFAAASALQRLLVEHHLLAKAVAAASSGPAGNAPPATAAPPTTLITASFPPTYTLGRRETALTRAQHEHLRAGGCAAVVRTLRGGQTTFHGPGQLTGYLVLDLRTWALSPRRYVQLLEESVVALLARVGLAAFGGSSSSGSGSSNGGNYGNRSGSASSSGSSSSNGTCHGHPGVWTTPTDKVCAVGVHVRRGITSFGVGLNVHTDLAWFRRIVACGLPAHLRVTSMHRAGAPHVSVPGAALGWERELARVLRAGNVRRWGVRVRAAGAGGLPVAAEEEEAFAAEETGGADVGDGVRAVLGGDAGLREWAVATEEEAAKEHGWACYDAWVGGRAT